MATGIGIARKGWLGPGDVLNARPADDVLAFARARRAEEEAGCPRVGEEGGTKATRKRRGTVQAAARKRRPVRARPGARPALLLDRLLARYPDAHCALDFTNAYELLVATILSAQCTDKRVNMVTPALFARYPDARARAGAPGGRRGADQEHRLLPQQGEEPHRHGDGRRRAPRRRGAGDDGALVVLPGVGRKTANVILGNAFGLNEGIVVDTHVTRLSNRLALAKAPIREDRARPARAVPAGAMDHALAPAHLARPSGLRREEAAVRGVLAGGCVFCGELVSWIAG